MFLFHGEDPRGRARSLSSPLGRSLSSCKAGGGWGAPLGGRRGKGGIKVGYLVKIKDQQAI